MHVSPSAPPYHAVQFYKDAKSLAETSAKFLMDGLTAGEPIVIVATSVHAAAILAELGNLGCDTHAARTTGEIQTFDARKMMSSFMVNNRPDPLLFRSNVGDVFERVCGGRAPCPVRVYGEMVDLLWQEGNTDGAVRLEILWNQLASTYEFSLLCGYAVGQFYKETYDYRGVRAICEHHSHVIS